MGNLERMSRDMWWWKGTKRKSLYQPTPETWRKHLFDGKWSPWTSWSLCSNHCGKGSQNRDRSCDSPAPDHGGAECKGNDTEERECVGCPFDGNWGIWAEWTDCCVNKRSRSRTCDNPTPEHGGSDCGQWSTGGKPDPIWSTWSTCPVTCSGGEMRRSRFCNLTPDEAIRYQCFNKDNETEKCSMQPCPAGQSLTDWSVWGSCSMPCGDGNQTRFRNCGLSDSEVVCDFRDVDIQTCSQAPCPSM
ncbi:hemicentin-1-like [Ostrea edulis]|uniref:hemicentin-1-like n=1 Tax=Ostrea edulis TaxID=37623 RepID=UPI0024AF7958|nr:hemicentin-1-like [Ostrea edulis]